MKALVLAFILPIFGVTAYARDTSKPVTMQDLDRTISKAQNLDEFLRDKRLQARYLSLLKSYYGDDDFSDEAYYGILDQLRKLARKVPGIKSRLWQTVGTGSAFSIETSVRTSGRELDRSAWNAYLERWKNYLEGLYGNLNADALEADVRAAREAYDERFRQAQAAAQFLPKRQVDARMAEFFKSERTNPLLTQLAARLLSSYLQRESTRDAFQSGDADLILEVLEDMKNDITAQLGFGDLPSPLVSNLKDLIPAKSDLLSGWVETVDKAAAGDPTTMTKSMREYVGTDFDMQGEFNKYFQQLEKQPADKAETFKTAQRGNPNMRRAAAILMTEVLSRPGLSDIDTLLPYLRDHIQDEIKLPAGVEPVPEPVLWLLQKMIPSNSPPAVLKTPFPVSMRKVRGGKMVPAGSGSLQTYVFEPIPRRIHGIWKGIAIGECIGGGDVNDLTPERWATVALQDTQFYHVHQGDSYLGFVQLVPIKKGKDTYGSVDFGAPVMSRKVILRDKGGHAHAMRLFNLWLRKAQANLPPGWRGILVGEGNAINNSGVLSAVHDSPVYQWGPVVGPSKKFRRTDPIGTKIIKVSPRTGTYIPSYRGRMVFDGVVQGAGDLRRLVNADPNFAQNPRKVTAALDNGTPEFRVKVLELLASTGRFENPEIVSRVVSLLESKDKKIREAAVAALVANASQDPMVIDMKKKLLLSGKLDENAQHRLWDQLADAKAVDDRLVDLAVSRLAGSDINAWALQKYLDLANLSHVQIDKLYAGLERRKWKTAIPLQDIVLGKDYDSKRRKQTLTRLMESEDSGVRVKNLAKLFFSTGVVDPDESFRILKIAARGVFMPKNSSSVWSSDTKEMEELISNHLSVSQQKELYFELIPEKMGYVYQDAMINILLDSELSKEELLKLIPLNSWHNETMLAKLLSKIQRPDNEILKELFLIYIGYDDTSPKERYKAVMLEYFRANSPEEEKYLLELIAWVIETPQILRSTYDTDKIFELRRDSEILEDGDRVIPDWLQEKILAICEAPKENAYKHSCQFAFDKLNLQDPAIVERIENIYIEDKAYIGRDQFPFMAKLPYLKPRLVGKLREVVESIAKYDPKTEMIAVFEQTTGEPFRADCGKTLRKKK